MAGEDEKVLRTSAKRKFTRCFNRLNDAILNKGEKDIILEKYNTLKILWDNVQSAHDTYLFVKFPEDEDFPEEEEAWLNELEEKMEIIEKQKIDCLRNMVSEVQEDDNLKVEQRLIEQTNLNQMVNFRNRESAKLLLIQEIKSTEDLITMDKNKLLKHQVMSSVKDVKLQIDKCKDMHMLYVASVTVMDDDPTMNIWIEDIYKLYEFLNIKVYEYLESVSVGEAKDRAGIGMRMERLKMPSFSGNIRHYAKFKYDFKTQVYNQVDCKKTLSYIIKSCLSEKALSIVENIDDVDSIWKRLDTRFGQPSVLIDMIMNEVRNLHLVREDDKRGFIQLVNIVEKGYADLGRLNLEREMSNSVTVSMIEEKLPPSIKHDWSKKVIAEERLRIISDDNDSTPFDKFPKFIDFLTEQRSVLEYEMANLRIGNNPESNFHTINFGIQEYVSRTDRVISNCIIHQSNNHNTEECRGYVNKSPEDKISLLRELRACWSCLKIGHRAADCRSKRVCGINGCSMNHHKTLHDAQMVSRVYTVDSRTCGYTDRTNKECLLQVMNIQSIGQSLTVLWDSGATTSLITFEKANELNLKGQSIDLSVIKLGGQMDRISSLSYTLPLIDKRNNLVNITVYGIERISNGRHREDLSSIIPLFKGINASEVQRPDGDFDILIGFNYASLHPIVVQSVGDLLLMQNRFGKCLAGSHQNLREKCQLLINNVEIYNVIASEEGFLKFEEMGVQCFPLCGKCGCGKCALGTKGLSIKEEREQKLISSGLSYQKEKNCFVSTYPWIKNPADLPNNYGMALSRLESIEKRLLKNNVNSKVYDEQITDMLNRGVAKILSKEEVLNYSGPYYYLNHHEVLKEGTTTPCRIVMNSSAKYKGQCLNDYWAKGANLINNLLGVILRFRENKIAITGDIRKMYHAVKISNLDQQTHRFLWRNFETHRKPDIYVMTSVSFGDKPAGNIAIAALHKTAEIGKKRFPRAADMIINNTYVDDIVDSVENEKISIEVTNEIDELLRYGGFSIKKWITSSNKNVSSEEDTMNFSENDKNVLGMVWERLNDEIGYKIKLNFSEKQRGIKVGPNLTKEDVPNSLPEKMTKRILLSQMNSIFDPLGLVAPFTVRAKLILKNLWRLKLDWDEEIIGIERRNVLSFLHDMFDIEKISFKRCMKPEGSVGSPILITFADASNDAFGACCYFRWKMEDGSFKATLVASKNRVSPMRVITIPRLELCSAVIAKRLSQFIEQESRYNIEKKYFFVDSQVVRSMIAKESHAFTTFIAVRLGEIHETTSVEDWYWLDGNDNIADWITRGKNPSLLGSNSVWQSGPSFLMKSEHEWPIKSSVMEGKLPEENNIVVVTNVAIANSIENIIDINRYSRYLKLINVTARIFSIFAHLPKPSLLNLGKFPADLISKAELAWLLEVQKLLNKGLNKGEYKRLCPRQRDDGVIIVGGRVEACFSNTYNNPGLILLPHNHRFSHLYVEYIHNISHLGTAATVCKVRERFWITRLTTIANNIRNKCVTCRKLNKILQDQVMAQVPPHRLKPVPAFCNTYLDFFGPFKIKSVVNKRSRGKTFGVIFTCGNSRAIYCDLAQDYSTDGFLQTFRRFVSIRGYPSNIWSDCGSQLVAADKELTAMVKGFDKDTLRKFGSHKGMEWHFSPPDAKWHNGCAESLIKSVKKGIKVAIGDQVLSFPELQTVLFEVSNLVNERPIGVLNKNIEDGCYLSPNNLLLGRASDRAPSGPFQENVSAKRRFFFIQKLIDAFWKLWIRDYFPCILIRQKWHVKKRATKVGDIVIIRDLNAVRGQWQLGRIEKVYNENDGVVRRVDIRHKSVGNNRCTIINRAIQSLVILLPVEEDSA